MIIYLLVMILAMLVVFVNFIYINIIFVTVIVIVVVSMIIFALNWWARVKALFGVVRVLSSEDGRTGHCAIIIFIFVILLQCALSGSGLNTRGSVLSFLSQLPSLSLNVLAVSSPPPPRSGRFHRPLPGIDRRDVPIAGIVN